MTTLALFLPDTLVGMELRNSLEETGAAFERVVAFSHDPEDVGNLIDAAGHAVRVEELTAAALENVDLLISCAETFRSNLPLLTALESVQGPRPRMLLVAPDTPVDAGEAIVPAVHLDTEPGSLPDTIVVPHPAVIMLSRLLHDLRDLGIESSSTTVLQPASVLGQGAMNEVFGQARSLLTMDGKLPTEHFGFQSAFSIGPSRHGGDADLQRRRLRSILGGDQHDLQMLQAGSFHGLGLSVHLRFDESVSSTSFSQALSALESEWEELEHDAGTVGRAEADRPGWTADLGPDGQSAWIWIAADNLTHAVAPTVAALVAAWLARQQAS